MKRLLLLSLIITTAFILYNCDDAGIANTEAPTYEVTGTINSWSLGSDKVLKAIVTDPGNNIFLADSTSISSTGGFTLKLKTPADNFLSTYVIPDPSGYTCTGTLTINPSTLKNATVAFDVYDASNTRIGGIQRKKFPGPLPQPGYFILSYLYFDNDAAVTGDKLCSSMTDSIRAIGNYNGNKGWDPVISLWDSVRVGYQRIQITWLDPPGGAWILQ